jgi:hypothetical protein
MTYLTFPNIDASFAGSLMQYLGSFWNNRFGEKVKVALLVSLAVQNKLLGNLRSITANLTGDDAGASVETYVALTFDPKSVVRTGQRFFDDPSVAEIYQAPTNVQFSYNVADMQYFAMPMPTHVPRVLHSTLGRQLLGVDFFALGKWLLFRKDPAVLFPTSQMMAVVADRITYKPLTTHLLRANVPQNSKYLTRYYRGRQTPDAFRLALAAVAGLQIVHYSQKLVAMWTRGTMTVYTFQWETLRVNYAHTPLVVGQTYAADTVIGNGIQVFYDRTGAGASWWRAMNWGPGIVLDPILRRFPGVPLLNRTTVAYGAGAGSGGNQHVRIKLSDDFLAEKPYWDWVEKREAATGRYLNSVLGLASNGTAFENMVSNFESANMLNLKLGVPIEQPDLEALPGVKRVNAMDVFFTNVLNQRALVIMVGHDQIVDQPSFYNFLQREMLAGVIPIVVSRSASLGVESAANGVNISFSEGPVGLMPAGSLTLMETLVLSPASSVEWADATMPS